MKYYSGSGDDGMTSLASGRVPKTNKVIRALGDLDELLAFLGDAHSKIKYTTVRNTLKDLERSVYSISARVSGYADLVKKRETARISGKDVTYLENAIKFYSKDLKPMSKFLYPNGSPGGSALNVCRTAARKAERSVLEAGVKDRWVLKYMNRLSSLLFVMSRFVNKTDGYKEEFFD